ncbi:MAG: chorismate mutase [Acidobacteriota bacterium]|nr:chorismate mutase [Acidobacteriota bacterium]MDH3529086.1 chorismate mutase [Acidobacteriota bacterium]
MNLRHLRDQIDLIDNDIAALLAKRARLARKIGVLKNCCGLPVRDPDREIEILERTSVASGNADTRMTIRRIFERVLDESRRIQTKVRPGDQDHVRGKTR